MSVQPVGTAAEEPRSYPLILRTSTYAWWRPVVGVVSLLLAPDATGRPAALARRMGVQEIIWDCKYWGGYASAFQSPTLSKYSACGKKVNKTTAHRDHIHLAK